MLDVRLHGPLSALTAAGAVSVRQGQAQLIPLGLSLTDLELRLQLATDTLHITQLAVRAGPGRLTGTGRLALQRYSVTTLALTLNADKLQVINTRQYVAAVSGQLICSGSLQEPAMRGALELRDTTLRPELALLRSGPLPRDPTIVVVQSAQDLVAPTPRALPEQKQNAGRVSFLQPDLIRRLALDLSVTIPRNTWVHLDEGSAELTGEIQARKNPAEELLLTGSLETVRGWYTFHGRRFRMEKGQMVFTGESPIDPSLDLVARYTLPKYQVDVVIGGTASTPTLTLRSDPPLEQADILSLLLFGKPAGTLTQGQKISLHLQALTTVAGYVATDLQRSVATYVGLDVLEVDVGEGLLQKSRIGVGKYVSEGVFVSTVQTLGPKSEREVTVEYQLDPHW